MITSGFTNAPVTKLLVFGIILTSFLATLTDTKYFFWIEVRPHLLDYAQSWRLLTWQVCYTNSTEVLFAGMSLYQLRIIERLWGTRKFASFLIATLPYTTLLPPILLATIIRPISGAYINYLPAGPTPILFALLAQYHAAIPYIYKYRLSSPIPATGSSEREYGLELTSKATSYLLPLQLAFSQLPGSAIAASIGWVVGFAYRREVLPGAARWRVPSWVIGDSGQKERALCGPTIAIEVGEGDSKASFQIFEGILCQFEWFACALKEGRFKEGEERRIKLPKTSPQTFKYFQYYAYSGKIDCIDYGLIANEDQLREHIKNLVELWIFGDAYGVTDLQIPSIFELRRLLNWACENSIHPVDKETLSLAYYSTDTKSPVCIIFAEFIVMRIEEFKDPESDYEFLGQYPGFITELYQAKGSGVGEGAEGRYKLYRNQDA
ncbi:hypothetical protein KC330_g4277 [Hortaea werneckii]|nr:hypothetical protein KC330_g4277 [Hortaea werneckii]